MNSSIIDIVLANQNKFVVAIRLASTIANRVVEANAKNMICGGANVVDVKSESDLLRQEIKNHGFNTCELENDEALYNFFVKLLIQEIDKRNQC